MLCTCFEHPLLMLSFRITLHYTGTRAITSGVIADQKWWDKTTSSIEIWGEQAVFQHIPSKVYYAAVRIGLPSNCPCGDDWRQEQAHLRRASEGIPGAELTGSVGPWTFYDLVFALEAGVVAPQEARAAGYVGDAIYHLSGHVRDLGCSTPEEALALLHIIVGGKGERDINACVSCNL